MMASSAAARSRAIAASASLRSLAISWDDCAEQFLLFGLCRVLRLRDQSLAFGSDLCARLVSVGACIGGLLAGVRRVGKSLFASLLPLDNDIHDRPEKEPGEEPDQNEDVDGLQRQRPPIDAHGLNG